MRRETKIIDKSFQEVTNRILPNTSFLNLFNILEDEVENQYLNLFRSYIINEKIAENRAAYNIHVMNEDEFLDDVSEQYYGTPSLWWVIALFNNIENPFEDLEPGIRLKILNETFLYQLFREMKNIAEL